MQNEKHQKGQCKANQPAAEHIDGTVEAKMDAAVADSHNEEHKGDGQQNPQAGVFEMGVGLDGEHRIGGGVVNGMAAGKSIVRNQE